MFELLLEAGYSGVDVFGATYNCSAVTEGQAAKAVNFPEGTLRQWYEPWLKDHGSLRTLDPNKVDAWAHQRAVYMDFWRSVAYTWGDGGRIDDHRYEMVIDLRWDHLVVDFSTCIFDSMDALEMASLKLLSIITFAPSFLH